MWSWLISITIIIIPVGLILIAFLMAHRWERERPFIERQISLSLWVGAASLLPGLTHVKHYGGGGIAISFESATSVRGWPLVWWGYQGFGQLWAPYALLADMALVAAITLICFSLVGVLDHRASRWISKKYAYPPIALILVLTPLWVPLLADAYNTPQEQASHLKYVAWVERNAETIIGSIQLEQCSDFALVPSSARHPGTMNIQVSVTSRVNEPHYFEISAHIQATKIYGEVSIVTASLNKQLLTGEQTLDFIIYPIDIDSDYVRIDKPGPYKILIVVNQIAVADDFQTFFGSKEFDYARDNLGISSDNLILECQSPPYSLADLGLPISPTSQP